MKHADHAWILAVMMALAGCGRAPAVPEGCTSGEAVLPRTRDTVVAAARTFIERARAERWSDIYAGAAEVAREQRSQDAFVAPLVQVRRTLGFPLPEATTDLVLVRFGNSFLHSVEVECMAPGGTEPSVFKLTDHPLQASLIEEAPLGGERLAYATLWMWEKGAWRLASFSARPATYLGANALTWAARAREERRADRIRNAALLYNLALDLAVPAPWLKPATVTEVVREQRRLSATHLPADRLDLWAAGPDTFRVFSVDILMRPGRPGLLIKMEAVRDPADTVFNAAYAARLVDYVAKTFPEYRPLFGSVTAELVSPRDRRRVWNRTLPLAAAGGP